MKDVINLANVLMLWAVFFIRLEFVYIVFFYPIGLISLPFTNM